MNHQVCRCDKKVITPAFLLIEAALVPVYTVEYTCKESVQ